ncbi:related to rad9 protein [Ramularia collo-cygni]|uniref:DNA repair protein rad9 n=1 Tax=Ramularia collo-cygni TaxID=112498 RepID=A0A2D3UV26_9PEZI|nr:related to rad9 protein [Ramularia collo-cygni]CZT15907.1 related to rad9 protein [Ramularia collo-cygni]
MAVLEFSLGPDSTGRIYELLTCLAKFGDAVSIEARSEKLTLTALNSSRTAYASFALDAKSFFNNYDFDLRHASSGGDRFTCQLFNKALQSVFKGRTTDSRGRETAIERCDVSIQDQPDKTECRLIVKMKSKHGMTKTYRLTYESVEVMHALFDRTSATQGWKISSRVLREYVEYFAPKAEQLDLYAENGKAVFTSFTEKVDDGKLILKQPLETSISIHTSDFEDFHMQEGIHITISVKDFRAIVTHAETLKGPISAQYSQPTRPLQFSYQNHGMHCEFTLMTMGDGRGVSSAPNPNFVSTRSMSRQSSAIPAQSVGSLSTQMPPPARPNIIKPLSSQSKGRSFHGQDRTTPIVDPDPESLFMPQDGADDDRTWDPPNYERDDEEEMLGWDASNDDLSATMRPTVRDLTRPARASESTRESAQSSQDGVAPTQRLSQLQGMFD